jgi:hypothetical protein
MTSTRRALCSGRAGTVGGLLLSGLALAGLVLTAVPEAPAEGADRADRAECAPTDARARLTGPAEPGRDGSGTLTPEQAAEYDRMLRDAAVHQSAPAKRATVPVVVHVISAEDGSGRLSRATVEEQVDVLNTAFGGGYGGADTGIRFRLTRITRTVDDAWFSDFSAHEDAAKERLRRGGAGTLNLYTADLGEGVLGASTFPQEYADHPDADGVVVDHRSVPGGGREKFDHGFTAVHETGHWLGLYHTFQNGCEKPGDYVGDTPAESEQAAGCPEGRDTCADQAGDDPVTNFMNYSDDPCMDRFTRGQGRRMAEHWAAFRA